MTIRVGVNGFGRIGRNFYRALATQQAEGKAKDIEIVAVNDLTDNATLAHLLKFDSILGRLPARTSVSSGEDTIVIGSTQDQGVRGQGRPGRAARGATSASTSSSSRPASSPTPTAPAEHLESGVKKVIISAPAKDEDITIVIGVNDDKYDGSQHTSSPTPRAPRTASARWPRCSTTSSASCAA